MRIFLVLCISFLVFTNLPQTEGRHQITNFMKFLQIMKSKGWEKDLIDSKTFLPENLKAHFLTELEAKKRRINLQQTGKNEVLFSILN